jgi:hypothetical protein
MKPLALLAAAGALTALAACSSHTSTTAATKHRTVDTHPAVLVNCPKEYEAWTRGPARDLLSALNAVDSANATGDTSALVVALKQTTPAVDKAARSPMPACADPKGYWTALLMHVNAAASTGASGARPASVTVAMKGVPKIERELRTELKTTTGAKDSV